MGKKQVTFRCRASHRRCLIHWQIQKFSEKISDRFHFPPPIVFSWDEAAMGRPPSNGSPAFRFNMAEVIDIFDVILFVIEWELISGEGFSFFGGSW